MTTTCIRMSEAVTRSCSVKKMFSEISQNPQESTCARVSFLIKLQTSGNFIKKEALAQVFSCEFCDISKNTFFHRSPLVTESIVAIAQVFICKKMKKMW